MFRPSRRIDLFTAVCGFAKTRCSLYRSSLILKRVIFCCLLVLSVSAVISAQISRTDKLGSLRGLKGVHVVVETIDDTVARGQGLSESQVQTDVELRLRKAGVRVLTEKEWQDNPARPMLYVNLYLMSGEGSVEGLYVYSVSVEVFQAVSLKTAPVADTLARTWNARKTGYLGKQNLGDLRNSVADLVDQFLNDYLAANPREPPRPRT